MRLPLQLAPSPAMSVARRLLRRPSRPGGRGDGDIEAQLGTQDHSHVQSFPGDDKMDPTAPSAALDEKNLPSSTTSVTGPETEVCVQDPSSGQPTIFVLVKEDLVWVRAYLKDLDYRVALRRALRKHLYKWYALLIIVITISVLVSTKHTTIVDFCKPVTKRIRDWPGGWLIPIALLIIVSFPPLVGHEIIGILCGLVWGLGEGFGILAAGTFFGELATWVAFKWMCTTRAKKFEKRNKLYASLTQLIRTKSFTFVLILRFSAVPGHIVTAVSASAGAHFGSYCAAAVLTLPKQLTIVYLGTSFGSHKKSDTIISWCTTIATFIGTVIAAVYIYYQMRVVIRDGGANRLPELGHDTANPHWDNVKVHGATGVGAGTRMSLEGADHVRRSVDVIVGPHARLARAAAAATQPRTRSYTLTRTRSLPGPITELDLRDWLEQLDTAPAHAQVRVLAPRWRAPLGADQPAPPYSGPAGGRISPPAVVTLPPTHDHALGLSDLAKENLHTGDTVQAGSRPVSSVPAILLSRTYTPARSRADTLRGTVSLDIERPLVAGGEIVEPASPSPLGPGHERC